MRWADLIRRCRPRPGLAAAILGQLSQASTIIAILNAFVLLAGWTVAPGKVEALGTVLSVLDAIVLAALQERPPPSPPCPGDGGQP